MEIIKLKLQRKLHCASLLRPLHSIHQRPRSENVVKNKYPNSGAQLFFSIGILQLHPLRWRQYNAGLSSLFSFSWQSQQLDQKVFSRLLQFSNSCRWFLIHLIASRQKVQCTITSFSYPIDSAIDRELYTRENLIDACSRKIKTKKEVLQKKKTRKKTESKLNTFKH